MAERKCFIPREGQKPCFGEIMCEFNYYGGFALSQKQKCIQSLHEAFQARYPGKRVLEISSKSPEPLGVALSAFFLRLTEANGVAYPVENIFQSSKVFSQGGPYYELLSVSPSEAKKSEKLKESGVLMGFRHQGKDWPLFPKTVFYDWLYMRALLENEELAKKIVEFDAFTDIEFIHKKSINCQARAAAIFVALAKEGTLERALSDTHYLIEVY